MLLTRDFGIQRGDRVSVWLKNCPEFPAASFGVWRAGGVVTVINNFLKPEEVAFILADSGARIVITDGTDLLAHEKSWLDQRFLEQILPVVTPIAIDPAHPFPFIPNRGFIITLDLKRRRPDVRAYVAGLEQWIIHTLAAFNVRGERREDRVGVWVRRPEKGESVEDKIAAIGIRVRKWVTYHGISLNVEPDLEHFSGIVPCGVTQHGVTSLVDLGLPVDMHDADIALKARFETVFGPIQTP